MKTLIPALSLFLSLNCLAQTIDSGILTREVPTGTCEFEKCYTLAEVREKAGKFSYESQEGLVGLFTARQDVRVRTGQLLPSFNLRISNPMDIFDYIPNLVGFLFPSNWFKLKESKLHAKAQEHSYVTLVANQMSMGQGLFFASHQEARGLQILENHVLFSDKLVALAKKKYDLGETAGEDVEEISSMAEFLKSEAIVQRSMVSVSGTDISALITETEAGESVGPVQMTLPDLSGVERVNSKNLIAKILEVSPELKSIDYLIAASIYGRKARSFQFLTPESGTENAFGFGYLANVRIGIAETEKLRIYRKSFETNLKKALTDVATKHNSSLELYQHALSIENSLGYILEGLISDYEISSRVDINRVSSLIRESLVNQQMKNNAIHGYLQASIQLERLMLETPAYTAIAATIPRNRTSLDCYLRKENKDIKAAIDSGKLKVRDELKFTVEETKFCL